MCEERDSKTGFAYDAIREYRAGADASAMLDMAARKLGIATDWLSADELYEEICAWLGEPTLQAPLPA